MTETQLNPIQKEIYKALEKLHEKAQFTEAILAKRIRENSKLDKKHAGIGLSDLEKAVECIAEEKQIFYSLRLNSANDILIIKSESMDLLNDEARKRRHASEKSMKILTNGDLTEKKNEKGGKSKKIRTERKSMRVNEIDEW